MVFNRRAGGVTSRRGRVPTSLAMAIGIALAPHGASAEDPPGGAGSGKTLGVATWDGAYGQSQKAAYFDPFAKDTGIEIDVSPYNGGADALKAKLDGATPADVVDLSSKAADALCKDGQLENIDASILAAGPNGQKADEDFLPGALTPCGVASMAWSTAIAFDRQAFTKAQPSSIADLLDLKKFPGKRALPSGPRYTLELALLADGVQPADIYTTLATPEGADRAFAALDKIRPEIVWWDKAANPIDWLIDRKATMAAGYNGRIFRAAVLNRQRLNIIWDGQIYDLDLWAIPKAAPNKDDAKRFIAFATEPSHMATQAALIAYGPMRKSAIELVGKNPTVDIDMKTYLPTAPDNFKKALKFDEAWWDAHGEDLNKRFTTWREQPLPAADSGPTSAVPASGGTNAAPPPPPKPLPNKPRKPRGGRDNMPFLTGPD